MLWWWVRSFLFLFPAEGVHEFSKRAIRVLSRFLPMPKSVHQNPVGLAAGFDKNCEIVDVLPKFGFGHVEIGTVTPKPQGGNSYPRLFRNPSEQTLFNRMGFNNLGAGVISERLRRVKPLLPEGFEVGVNLGKNKSTPDTEAHLDYAAVAKAFLDTADYFVINVSSPNTPGLRDLQALPSLQRIVQAVQQVLASSGKKIPLYVKLAPEMTGETFQALLLGLAQMGVQGFVLTNTEAGTYIYREESFTGGWSGKNLTKISLDRLTEAKSALRDHPQLHYISVGGVSTPEHALQRIQNGANKVQFYTGWIYGGPFLAKQMLKRIRALRS